MRWVGGLVAVAAIVCSAYAGTRADEVSGRIKGRLTATGAIDALSDYHQTLCRAGRSNEATEEMCRTAEEFLASPAATNLTAYDVARIHGHCAYVARNDYLTGRLEHHYRALRKAYPDFKGDETFQARTDVAYRLLQDARKFPLDEKDIRFGQTLKSMGVAEKKTVHLRDFWNPTNVTAALQKLVDDPEVTTIVLDAMPTPWYVTSVLIGEKVTGKRILLKSGAKVLRCPFALRHRIKDGKSPKSLFELESCQNVIIESDAAKPEDVLIGYYESRAERLKVNVSEGYSGICLGHKMYARTTKNVVIRNVRIADCECDGILLASNWNPPEEIFVENVILDSNFRQGCSPCGYYSLYFKNVTFSNTRGGQPMAGFDVEPWDDYLTTGALYLFDCTFEGNLGGGFLLVTTTHEPVLVRLKRCRFKANGRASQFNVTTLPIEYIRKQRAPRSDVRIEDCTFESRGATFSFDPCPIYNVTVRNCLIRDVRGENEQRRGRGLSPIKVGISRDFHVADLPKEIEPEIVFDNVRIEGYEGASPVAVADEVGMLNIGPIFRGTVDWNGRKVDLSAFSYAAPDLHEPKTAFVPSARLLKPAKVPAADEAMPASNGELSFAGAWWLKQPIYSYYFWAEKGRKVSFDFEYRGAEAWLKVKTVPVYVVNAAGEDVKLADVSAGTTNLVYVAPDTGWHRFTPGMTIDLKSPIASEIVYYARNFRGARVAYQADTVSDCFAKFSTLDRQRPHTIYFEVPAGGKPCRVRANYGGFILKDPAGNVVDTAFQDDYAGRHVFVATPSTDKAEIWSLTTPAGVKGGWTRALRFYAPLNGIWADDPASLPCQFADHHVPAAKPVEAKREGVLKLDRSKLSAADLAVLEKAKADRRTFAEKREHAARKRALEKQIAEMSAAGRTDNVQHQIDDLTREMRIQARLAQMEETAAQETPDEREAAAFCQAFVMRLADDPQAADAAETVSDELHAMDLGLVRNMLEYDDILKLGVLVDAIVERMKR